MYKNRSSGKTDFQEEKRSSGSPILLKIVSENRFSGKTYFYTIATSNRRHGVQAQLPGEDARRVQAPQHLPPGGPARADGPERHQPLRAGDAVGDGEGGGVGEAPAGTVVLAIGWNEGRFEEARGFTPKIELYLPRIINTIYDCTRSMFYKRHPIRDIVLILERLRDSL